MGVLLGLGIIACLAWPKVGLFIIAFTITAILYKACAEVTREEIADYHARKAAIARRADRQHAAALRGDPYGMYGEYPPDV